MTVRHVFIMERLALMIYSVFMHLGCALMCLCFGADVFCAFKFTIALWGNFFFRAWKVLRIARGGTRAPRGPLVGANASAVF
jgi:uncharacterized membrane protein